MTLDSEAAVLARFGVVEPKRATLDWFPLDFR